MIHNPYGRWIVYNKKQNNSSPCSKARPQPYIGKHPAVFQSRFSLPKFKYCFIVRCYSASRQTLWPFASDNMPTNRMSVGPVPFKSPAVLQLLLVIIAQPAFSRPVQETHQGRATRSTPFYEDVVSVSLQFTPLGYGPKSRRFDDKRIHETIDTS